MNEKDRKFHESKKRLLEGMVELLGEGITKVIPFPDNDDVPNYLRKLDEIERLSRESKIMLRKTRSYNSQYQPSYS